MSKIYKYLNEIAKNELTESRGGWLIGLVDQLEEAFDQDAGYVNGKYIDRHPIARHHMERYVSEKDHKALTKALINLTKVMKKAYKGKLSGF